MIDIYRKHDDGSWEKVTHAEFFGCCSQDELRHFRAIINGKLSTRVITPDQQAKMQAARQKVI